jgi:hypothetical protein
MNRRLWAAALVLVAGLLNATALFAQNAGTVQFVSGQVSITRNNTQLTPAKADIINAGDVIATEANGQIQLTMVDGASISLRPSSRMTVEKYDYTPATPTLGNAVIALANGAMRVFTGELVNRNKDRFQMKTPIATLGIRGSGNVLAHFEGTGTINHTLTGAHSVTSQVGGTSRTLVSLPGQTIQVLPGQAPRFIPTPSFILAAASTAAKSSSSGDAEKTDGSQSQPAAAAAPTTSSTNTTNTNPAVAAAQGAVVANTTTTVLANTTSTNVLAFFRTVFPLSSGGFQGVSPLVSQSVGSGGSAILNSSGQLVSLPNTSFTTFLSGPASAPNGYSPINVASANVRFVDGVHRDGYRTADGSVIIGRWEGGSVSVTDLSTPGAAATLYALGPRSLSYAVQQGTPGGISAAFTGTTTYSLVGATAPTDAAGNAGRLNTASVAFNFSALTAALNATLTINNQNLTLSGTTSFAQGNANPQWSRSSPTQVGATLDIACTGSNCASVGYTGAVGTSLAGTNGGFAAGQYRIVPTRQAGSGFSDQITGVWALQAGSIPTVGIVLPQSGTANLNWTNITNVAPTNSVTGLTIAGTLQANFSTRTVSFTANVGGTGPNTSSLPVYTATATNAPIVGIGFSASTTPGTNVGALTVTCAGAACAAATSRFGRFDGFFTNNTGTSGTAQVSIGDAGTGYYGAATFGTATGPIAAPVAAPKPGRLVIADINVLAGSGALAQPAPLNGAQAISNRAWRSTGVAQR